MCNQRAGSQGDWSRSQQREAKAWTGLAESSKEERRKQIKLLFPVDESIINVYANGCLTLTLGILHKVKLAFINRLL